MGNRIADNIRRIVWDTIVKEWGGKDGKLSDLIKDRDALPGARGIGYQNSTEEGGGSGTQSSYNPLGTTKKDTSEGSTDEGGDSATSGAESAEDVIDGAAELGNNLASGVLEGMDGMTDPITGDDMAINFHDQFEPIKEGYGTDGTYNPDWPDPDEPPELDNWESGKYWYTNAAPVLGNASYYSTTPQQQAALGVNYLNAFSVGGVTDWQFVSWSQTGATSWIGNYASAGTTNKAQVGAVQSNCTPGVDASCPVNPPVAEGWPEDGKIGFKFEDGKFKTSEYDPEQPINYINDSSKVEFNFGAGRSGAAEAFKDGGYGMYETDSIGGSPTGNVQRYNSQGVFQESFPAAQIGNYRPS